MYSRIPLTKYLNGLGIEAEGLARKQLLTSRSKGFSNFQVLEMVLRKHKLLLNEERRVEKILEREKSWGRCFEGVEKKINNELEFIKVLSL